jgi:hypothetical protein
MRSQTQFGFLLSVSKWHVPPFKQHTTIKTAAYQVRCTMCAPTSKSCLTSTIAEATSSSLNHRFQHIASGATTSNYAYHDDVQDDDQMSTIQSLAGAAAAVLVAVDRHWHGLFPARLYNMLSDAGPSNFGHVVSWACHGRCFRVHRPKEFVEQVMPR